MWLFFCDQGAASAQSAAAPDHAATCPDPDVVWALVATIVPDGAEQLRAARRRVEIIDGGDQYVVRVGTGAETLERAYVDPARDCERRAQFAAEFIVLALMPPQLGTVERPPSVQPGEPPPPPGVTNGAVVSRPAQREAPARFEAEPMVWIEPSLTGMASPSVLGAPSVFAWGIDLRGCVGSGALAGLVGIGFTPSTDFSLGDLRATITRVPAFAGLRLRSPVGRFLVSGDFGLVLAWERYAGTSPRTPLAATRWTPGFAADLVVSIRPSSRWAPFARLGAEVLPFADALGTTPEGVLGKTPSLWLGGALGLAVAM